MGPDAKASIWGQWCSCGLDERLGRKKWAWGLGLRGEGGGSSDIASYSLAKANGVYPSEVKRGLRNSKNLFSGHKHLLKNGVSTPSSPRAFPALPPEQVPASWNIPPWPLAKDAICLVSGADKPT